MSLAVDLVQFTYEQSYDVAMIVSQDWDFGSAIRLVKKVAKDQRRWLTFESAFPYEEGKTRSPRGVPGCTWIHIDKATYDACYDPTDYRPVDPPSP